MLRAGTLNRRVRIERPVIETLPSGKPVSRGWELVAEVWANIRVASGKEHIAGGAELASTSASFRIRWRTGLTTDMRLVHAGVVYDITAVLPDLAGREHVDLVATTGERKV